MSNPRQTDLAMVYSLPTCLGRLATDRRQRHRLHETSQAGFAFLGAGWTEDAHLQCRYPKLESLGLAACRLFGSNVQSNLIASQAEARQVGHSGTTAKLWRVTVCWTRIGNAAPEQGKQPLVWVARAEKKGFLSADAQRGGQSTGIEAGIRDPETWRR